MKPRSLVSPHVPTLAGLATALALLAGCATTADPNAQLSANAIDDSVLVTLAGNTHPKATAQYDVGRVDDNQLIAHMQLVLRRSAPQQAALDTLIAGLHDPTSPQYQQWLTADEFADEFGVAPADVAVITGWLAQHGFTVDSVADSRMFIEFSGTAKQIRDTFHTEIHNLSVKGAAHIANMWDPQIPAALAPVVVGIHALHDFMPHPLVKTKGVARRSADTGQWTQSDDASPDFTVNDGSNGTFFAVAPADFATIYNENPLFDAGIRGSGQTVVVIEDTNIQNVADVATFRKAFGLSKFAGTFKQESPTGKTACANPGVNQDETEAALDAEWAGATAPDAAIVLASCADTATVFGGLIAVQNLINSKTPPPIMSISYGECEADNGKAANQSYVTTYEQAVAEGVSVFVSSGDEGAASCDADEPVSVSGIAVSGFASTPFNVAVGGTDFGDSFESMEGGPPVTQYWSTTNSATFASATGYVPEIPWNDSCASKLLFTVNGFAEGFGAKGFCNDSTVGEGDQTTASASGGPSAFSKQPKFQEGVVGLPTASGGPRYLPDVSLFAANGIWGHFLVFCLTDVANGGVASCNYKNTDDILDLAAGGTSFASPALAGIQALVNQKQKAKQGNPNVKYYALAAKQYGKDGNPECNSDGGTSAFPVLPSSECIFNDVTLGDIDVNCTGTLNCFGTNAAGTIQGVLSVSDIKLEPAFAAGVGWDYATGLGTVNATNLVNKW